MIDSCPACEGEIIAVCSTVVEYLVVNNNEEEQSWERLETDDDSSIPCYFRCSDCLVEWTEFELDENGFLVCLEENEG